MPNNETDVQYIAYYACDCGKTWQEIWDCPCNGECPACETSDIEPYRWERLV